jgi:hypothetical protein
MTILTPDQREDLIDAIAETMSDTCDMDVSFAQHARAIVGMLEKRGALQTTEASADMEKLAAWMLASSFAPGDEGRANAYLFGAAPELLGALKWFIDDIDGTHTVMIDFDANVARARAAIAKAEGV